MLKSIFYPLIFVLLIATCNVKEETLAKVSETPASNTASSEPVNGNHSIENKMMCLIKAYPDFLEKYDGKYLYWKDGTKMLCDDGKIRKDIDDSLDNANIVLQMAQCYKKGKYKKPLDVNYEPGRIRYEPFFLKMYGSSKEKVSKNLVAIRWMPKISNRTIRVSKINGIDKQLKAVSNDLEKLPPKFHKYVEKLGGTFNWRAVRGADRKSPHSYGIAIDINVAESHFWRNAKPNKKGIYDYKNSIPMEIVEIFEKHGFIWGGKWYHYDTMHFEYRPELLLDECGCNK